LDLDLLWQNPRRLSSVLRSVRVTWGDQNPKGAGRPFHATMRRLIPCARPLPNCGLRSGIPSGKQWVRRDHIVFIHVGMMAVARDVAYRHKIHRRPVRIIWHRRCGRVESVRSLGSRGQRRLAKFIGIIRGYPRASNGQSPACGSTAVAGGESLNMEKEQRKMAVAHKRRF
jgi:hypothetical protein